MGHPTLAWKGLTHHALGGGGAGLTDWLRGEGLGGYTAHGEGLGWYTAHAG